MRACTCGRGNQPALLLDACLYVGLSDRLIPPLLFRRGLSSAQAEPGAFAGVVYSQQ